MIRVRLTEERYRVRLQDDTYQVGTDISYATNEPFDGSYEYIPSEETQTVSIEGKRATENIIIRPIPSNYGRVAWTGTVLTLE